MNRLFEAVTPRTGSKKIILRLPVVIDTHASKRKDCVRQTVFHLQLVATESKYSS
jgi:hypothetical protein